MNRRSFLSLFSALPFIGFFLEHKPKSGQQKKVSYSKSGYKIINGYKIVNLTEEENQILNEFWKDYRSYFGDLRNGML